MGQRQRVALVIAAGLLAAALSFTGAAPPATAQFTGLTRLRLDIQTTSDWAKVELRGIRTRVSHVAEKGPQTNVTSAPDGFTVRGVPAAHAVIDVVVEVPDGADPEVRLGKGMIGTAAATITRTAGDAQQLATLENAGSSPFENTVAVRLTPEALIGPGLVVPKVDDRKLVLAFYYPWFNAGRFDRGVWVDRPSGEYAVDRPEAVRAMVDQAADAGISGFLVEADGLDHVPHFDYVLDAAAARPGFQVAAYLDIAAHKRQSLLGEVVDEAKLIATGREVVRRAVHDSYLRVDGRPVVGVFGMWETNAAQWARVRAALEAVAGPLFVVGDRIDASFAAEGFHYYNPNTRGAPELAWSNSVTADRLRLPPLVDPSAPLRLWAATVSPGENNLLHDPLRPVYRDRAGGARYDSTWNAALASDPDWVLVTSWNEWFEATHIQPGRSTGTIALGQTRDWASRWRTSG